MEKVTSEHILLPLDKELQERLHWFTRLRWVAGIAILIGVGLGPPLLGIRLPFLPLSLVALAVLSYNLMLYLNRHWIAAMPARTRQAVYPSDRPRLGGPDPHGLPDRRDRQPGQPDLRVPPHHRRHPAVAPRVLPAGVLGQLTVGGPGVDARSRGVPDLGFRTLVPRHGFEHRAPPLGRPDTVLPGDDVSGHLHHVAAAGKRKTP